MADGVGTVVEGLKLNMMKLIAIIRDEDVGKIVEKGEVAGIVVKATREDGTIIKTVTTRETEEGMTGVMAVAVMMEEIEMTIILLHILLLIQILLILFLLNPQQLQPQPRHILTTTNNNQMNETISVLLFLRLL